MAGRQTTQDPAEPTQYPSWHGMPADAWWARWPTAGTGLFVRDSAGFCVERPGCHASAV